MKKTTFNYIWEILKDYNDVDEHIKRRIEELRYPHRETDLNADIKGTKVRYDSQDIFLITIEQDARLAALERNKRIITETLEEFDQDTNMIIRELYMKKRPQYSIQGLISNHKIFIGRSKASDLRTAFFIELAKKFNLDY
ncbi:transcriptional regulator [Enterococcus sp. MMGLQ5-2]|nr:transcriptional regulator [Enterococcus sp. MMGLQ5-2]MBS7583248.1 transcriptional regulator [Enterococcus sp. MMGLQ5-1]NPD11108.1 transcriptional regulator [Enterococcus sp. MMGLQ5-1]NPD35851.1 transcriptional regulator [Enterococcus sp. MMGLQ5-2]